MIAHLHVTSFFLHAVNGEREKVRCAAIVRNVDCRKLSYINFVSKHICFERYHHAPSCRVAFLFLFAFKACGLASAPYTPHVEKNNNFTQWYSL